MSEYPLFNSRRIFDIHQPVSQQQLLEQLAASLYADGFVKDSFAQQIIERETKYPTGIDMESHAVAIPHTEFDQVYHTGFAIAINHAAVQFFRSDATDQQIIPDIIVMMAIAAGCEKVVIIQSLFTLLACQQSVNTLCHSETEKIAKLFTAAVKTR